MNRNQRNIIILIVLIAGLLAGALAVYNTLSSRVAPEDPIPTVSEEENEESEEESRVMAPDFTVLDTLGNEISFSEMTGNPIVLNFWASWCPPCKEEMPEFDKLYSELGDSVTFMMVDLVGVQGETIETGAAHVEEQGYAFPVYYDVAQEAAYAYGVSSIPMTVFIDEEGYIVTYAVGMLNERSLRQAIDSMLTI